MPVPPPDEAVSVPPGELASRPPDEVVPPSGDGPATARAGEALASVRPGKALAEAVRGVLGGLAAGAVRRGGPVPAETPGALAAQVARALAEARGEEALGRLTELLAYGAADPTDPACAAHLHCPPLAVAVAADLAVSALNPSLDSWDQAPAATELETLLLRELAGLAGYPGTAAGVLTSGGTESNVMGLMLARDRVLERVTGEPVQLRGLSGRVRPRIFASAAAHFSVRRAAALLGLGEDAVVAVPVDRELRMDPAALERALREAARRGEPPVAVVATAGTTDTGAIDPLPECAALAAEHGAWLHVDAAYGGGALLSDRLAPLLAGVELADSISLDWHKLGWQPAAAGVFLVRREETYASLARRAAYLNPADDEEAGYPSLLGRSLRTTRRADAFKIAVTLRTLGRDGLGRLVDACHDLARAGAAAVRAHPRLELHAEPVLTAFLFRYLPRDPRRADEVNAALRRRLLRAGLAVVGRTELPEDAGGDHDRAPGGGGGREPSGGRGRVRLKLTLLNPHATVADVERLVGLVAAAGEAEEAGLS
ncbi:aminotransferase class V-fold PLP-dependent enzyme [Nonomuraea rhodomycinica]|uniref:Aminotransferase class V-fold PLP-dependent enzyme n=1 Tax=Nonomuraea rhodomycinica TaxID=1712872 RepID=A0A7Y6MCT5_9ACTN|nr:aminotransferase class V-fold PLP-dependent enzyme [Nonomuraea rhodomycinica]